MDTGSKAGALLAQKGSKTMDTGSKARTFSAPKLWIQVVRRALLAHQNYGYR
jgi:hypothetical protein